MDYTFTIDHPPKLQDFGNAALVLPVSVLSKPAGEAKWEKTNYRGQGETIYVSDFTLTRTFSWVAVPPAERKADDETVTIKQTYGYHKEQKETFTQNLEVDAGGNFFDVIDLSVKASSNISDTDIEKWTEEY